MQETLPILLRMVDPEEFAKYDSMTPTGLDYLGDYRDGVDVMPFQLDIPSNATIATSRPVVYLSGTTNADPADATVWNG